MPPSDDFDELWRSFEGMPRLEGALQNEAQRHLFNRLVSVTHRQGWDWWTVKSTHDGPVRAGRNHAASLDSPSAMAYGQA